jgi:hypothetical protein
MRRSLSAAPPGSGKSWFTIARELGRIAAAPSPWIARAPISTVAFGAAAQKAEEPPNATSPARNSRRDPARSARSPAPSIPAASTMA